VRVWRPLASQIQLPLERNQDHFTGEKDLASVSKEKKMHEEGRRPLMFRWFLKAH